MVIIMFRYISCISNISYDEYYQMVFSIYLDIHIIFCPSFHWCDLLIINLHMLITDRIKVDGKLAQKIRKNLNMYIYICSYILCNIEVTLSKAQAKEYCDE